MGKLLLISRVCPQRKIHPNPSGNGIRWRNESDDDNDDEEESLGFLRFELIAIMELFYFLAEGFENSFLLHSARIRYFCFLKEQFNISGL